MKLKVLRRGKRNETKNKILIRNFVWWFVFRNILYYSVMGLLLHSTLSLWINKKEPNNIGSFFLFPIKHYDKVPQISGNGAIGR